MLFVLFSDLQLLLTKCKALIAVLLTCLANRGGNTECVRLTAMCSLMPSMHLCA